MDAGTAAQIGENIQDTIESYEPRIDLLQLDVDVNFDDNGFDVSIEFEIIGREDQPVTVEFLLERTR